MLSYKYLIIGGGMTADACVQGIREIDSTGSIAIISSEPHPPYSRPPLSKALWKEATLDSIWRNTEKHNVKLHPGTTATTINPQEHTVTDDKKQTYSYEKLLLATGGKVRKPWSTEGIIYFRTLNDYIALRELTNTGKTFVVIGGGFIGSEIAAALAMNGKSVTMIFPEKNICERVFSRNLASFVTNYYAQKGVTIMANSTIASIEKRDTLFRVTTGAGKELDVDGVIAGIGISPDVELAAYTGLKTDNGIVVNEFLKTSHTDIYAAGDAANFYSSALGKRIRVEHEDNALTMGKIAGCNMAGKPAPYDHLPSFYSDLFDLGYEAVGELDSRFTTVEDWKEEFREGVVYYLHENRIRGVLLWNTWSQVDNARALIAEKGPFTRENVKGLLPK